MFVFLNGAGLLEAHLQWCMRLDLYYILCHLAALHHIKSYKI